MKRLKINEKEAGVGPFFKKTREKASDGLFEKPIGLVEWYDNMIINREIKMRSHLDFSIFTSKCPATVNI